MRLQGAAKARLGRCLGRGVNLTAVRVAGTAAEVLFDGCLFYTEGSPLVDVSGPDQAPVTLRVIRSTLVAGRAFLRLRPDVGQVGLPRLQGLGWDALVARCGPLPRGDFLALPDPKDVEKVSWKSMNCVYTGWDMLEPGPYSRVLPDAWPKTPPDPETVSPSFFDPRDAGGLRGVGRARSGRRCAGSRAVQPRQMNPVYVSRIQRGADIPAT